ncbi:MAG: aminotransferase class I/II-fold pyridoxal phosphate-dependent enzyme [Candidatus Micrarchaeota archaeon]|nr:aminotransferase class I/II-fold pyridoxal phosphate-dependent enzyme [Candidatus Micrarchaeota archaeon]
MSFKSDTLAERMEHAHHPIRKLYPLAEEIKKSGVEIYNANIGDPVPYLGTAKYIVKAYCKALKDGKASYSRSPGDFEFLDEIAKRYKRLYNLDINSSRIFATHGVSEALIFLIESLIEKGRGAVVFNPYYPLYASTLKLFGGTIVLSTLNEEEGWAPSKEDLEGKIKKAKDEGVDLKFILVTNPSNPTGSMCSRKDLEDVVEVAKNNDLLVVSDEIYDEMILVKEKMTCIGEVAKGVPHMIMNGLSKNWGATGFRIGWAIIPEEDEGSKKLREGVGNLATMRLSASTPAQIAGIEALRNVKAHQRFLRYMVRNIRERAEFMQKRLNEINGVSCQKAKGAFYLFPKIDLSRTKFKDDDEFCTELLRKEHVWVTKGSGFGLGNHLRSTALPPVEVLEKVAQGIENLMRA